MITDKQAETILNILNSFRYEEFEHGLLDDYIQGDFEDYDECKQQVLEEIKSIFSEVGNTLNDECKACLGKGYTRSISHESGMSLRKPCTLCK